MRQLIVAGGSCVMAVALLFVIAFVTVSALRDAEPMQEEGAIGARTSELMAQCRKQPREQLSFHQKMILDTYDNRINPASVAAQTQRALLEERRARYEVEELRLARAAGFGGGSFSE